MLNPFRPIRLALPSAVLAASTVLTACSSTPAPKFQQEMFDTGASPYSRTFSASGAEACEAARRALLNQGYLTTAARADTIDATKDFQPTGESHVTVDFHVVCTDGQDADGTSTVYANAVQSGYTLKKSDTSATVGLSVLGSVSLPIRSNSDAMVKISSETIQSAKFYDRFFEYVDRYLRTVVKSTPVPAAPISTSELPRASTPMPTSPLSAPLTEVEKRGDAATPPAVAASEASAPSGASTTATAPTASAASAASAVEAPR